MIKNQVFQNNILIVLLSRFHLKLTFVRTDKFRPLLDRMLDFTGTEDEFADDDIRDHVNTMVGAAYSTSAKSILFTLILVGSHDDVQSKLFKE